MNKERWRLRSRNGAAIARSSNGRSIGLRQRTQRPAENLRWYVIWNNISLVGVTPDTNTHSLLFKNVSFFVMYWNLCRVFGMCCERTLRLPPNLYPSQKSLLFEHTHMVGLCILKSESTLIIKHPDMTVNNNQVPFRMCSQFTTYQLSDFRSFCINFSCTYYNYDN